MADIELVIKIPEEFYEALRKTNVILGGQRSGKTLMSVIYNAVSNGTPLPKEHGRLIDAEILDLENLYRENDDGSFSLVYTKSEFSTIIEADKEGRKNELCR